jgi:hypothetical protein
MGIGDRLRAAFGRAPVAPVRPPVPMMFSASPVFPVDQLLLRMWGRAGVVTREEALTVPAVLRGRNMICSIGTLPLQAVDADNRIQDNPLLAQTDPNVANEVTLAMTLEDLLFESVAWWRVTGFDSEGFPARAVRYAPNQVRMNPPPAYEHGYLPSALPTEGSSDKAGQGPGVWMGSDWVTFDQVIRFDSPNPPLLVAGRRAISRAIFLDEAADLYARNPQARGFFTPTDGVDPSGPNGDAKIQAALDEWERARTERVDGYVPAALKYNQVQNPTPAELQILAQQQRADLAIANAIGIDPEDLGINTTSRTYQNATDRRQDKVNDVYAPYMSAITGRLSMPDVTRPGVRARFWLDDFLKADPKTRAEVQTSYNAMGATDPAEVRQSEGLPPREITPPAVRVPATVGNPVPAIEG